MANLIRQSTAEMLGLPSPAVADRVNLAIAFADPACQILISSPTDEVVFRSAIETMLGFNLPVEPNHVAGATARALWMAPRQWLIVSDDHADAGLAPRLEEAVRPCGGFVSDVTDGFAVFDLSGGQAARLLAMGCTLDLDAPALAPGRCARTVFAGIHALLYPYGTRERYRLHVERPFALHLCEWLQTAASAVE